MIIARGAGGLPRVPDEGAVSTMTLAELHVGVLIAPEPLRARRTAILAEVEREFEPLPIDELVARRFGTIVAEARGRGRRPKVADALIAATAVAYGLPLYTCDRDFEDLPGLEVVLA